MKAGTVNHDAFDGWPSRGDTYVSTIPRFQVILGGMRIPVLTFLVCGLSLVSSSAQEGAIESGVIESAGGRVAKRRLVLPQSPYSYATTDLPIHVRQVAKFYDNTPASNQITDAGATLGRVLFYDRSLSANGSVSCSSCHSQSTGFSDERRFSTGFEGKEVKRNSMSLVNLRFYKSGKFFWDERANSLEDQVLMPIEDPVEMGHSLAMLVKQLQKDAIYPPLFREAFGTPEVTEQRLARALAQFIRSMVSVRSRYDVGRSAVDSVHDPFPNRKTTANNSSLDGRDVPSAIYLIGSPWMARSDNLHSSSSQLRWSMESIVI